MTPLPRLLVLTDGDEAADAGHDLSVLLADVLAAGGPSLAVVVRERHLPPTERSALVASVAEHAAATGSLVVVASPATDPRQNVHLRAAEPFPAPRPGTVGRSCHDARELRAASAEGCDYATLSPIFPTGSKPGYGPALGPDALGAAPLPVYALGGVRAANARSCREAGATGVAVMGAVMRSPAPAVAVAALLDALGGHQ